MMQINVPKNAESKSSTRFVHVLILDKSGSMDSVRESTRTGFNEQIQTIQRLSRENPVDEHLFAFTLFDDRVDVQEFGVKAYYAEELSAGRYVPEGATALYDAIGTTLSRLNQEYNKEDKVLITIITDGYENSSKEYTKAAVKSLVEQVQKDKGWTVTYIGANHDVAAVSPSLGIRVGNSMSYSHSDEGTTRAYGLLRSARESYVCHSKGCATSNLTGEEIKDKGAITTMFSSGNKVVEADDIKPAA